jgi:hypothetical protein
VLVPAPAGFAAPRLGYGGHAPIGGRGSELFLELSKGLCQCALWEDELGDGKEPVLERLLPLGDGVAGAGDGDGDGGHVRRLVQGLIGHRGNARGAWRRGRSGSVVWEWRGLEEVAQCGPSSSLE